MGFPEHAFSIFAGLTALICGVITAIVLFTTGQGWGSLLPIFVFPMLSIAAVKFLIGCDA